MNIDKRIEQQETPAEKIKKLKKFFEELCKPGLSAYDSGLLRGLQYAIDLLEQKKIEIMGEIIE